MLENLWLMLTSAVDTLGYTGIALLMFLESSFFPFPSEVAIIPGGYLASQGKMNIFIVIAVGVIGSIGGAIFNYYLAVWLGRRFLVKYQKWLFLNDEKIAKMDKFFKDHGAFSTFSGRLLPGIRQYISFPAGLTRMNLTKFLFYTSLGAGIWVTILALVGYFVGENEILVKKYLGQIFLFILVGVAVLTVVYIYRYLVKKQRVNHFFN